METAPLIVFVYNRIEHIKHSLNALNDNYLANDTNLYIFSDYGKDLQTNEEVCKVREYLSRFASNSSFKSVTVFESSIHKGLAQSVISGVSSIISQNGKVIVVEDDVIVSRDFLNFMNDGLDFYSANNRVWSITGVGYNLHSLKNYAHDVYLVGRMGSDCWGIWEDRWNRIDWKVSDYNVLKNNILKRIEFNRFGRDMFSMLRRQMEGDIDSWAIRADFAQYMCNMQTVHPKKSFMESLGHDGTGTHHNGVDIFKWKMKTGELDYLLEDVESSKKIQVDYKRQYGVLNGLICNIGYYFEYIKRLVCMFLGGCSSESSCDVEKKNNSKPD